MIMVDTQPLLNPWGPKNTKKLKIDILIGTCLALWSVGMLLRGLKSYYGR